MLNAKVVQKERGLTIAKAVTVSGIAPFSGKNVSLSLLPSNKGYIEFVYKDHYIQACPNSIKISPNFHTTIIFSQGIEIQSVEHLLSALYGLGINSISIIIDGENQIPALDSSADRYTQILKKVGIRKIYQKKMVYKIIKDFSFFSQEEDSYAQLHPSPNLEVSMEINFNNIIGKQTFSLDITPESYEKELSWARTFIRSPLNGDIKKWERIKTILPFLPDDPKESPIIVFSDTAFIIDLIKQDEPIRHKMLDFLGDLALLRMGIEGSIKVYKPGHYFNHQLVRFLDSQIRQ